MSQDRYLFEIPPGTALGLGRAWLRLGVASLIGAGLLAVLLVLSRTPGIQDVFPLKDFFRAALIVHVDLSVLVWFMAFAGVLWSLAGNNRFEMLGWAGFWLAVAGTVLIVVSPFLPDTHPLLNNYIPILDQPVFFAGLWTACIGFAATALRALLTVKPVKVFSTRGGAIRFGILVSAIAGSLALAAFLLSWLQRPDMEGQGLYEVVFWGGGHTLQFQHALLMAVAWTLLADHLDGAPRFPPCILTFFFALAALPLLAPPVFYLLWPVASGQHMAAFARLMELGHGLMLPLIVVSGLALKRVWSRPSAARNALAASLILFAAGGVLAYLIKGVNVVIPAHYHGSIVGVTLAFMGLSYVLLPRLGFRPVSGRMANWQPWVYGGGQLMHVLGLAWSGGYGVQRKVAGAEQMLVSLPQKIGMGFMGLGGVIAIVGGVLFVIVCLKSMSGRSVPTSVS